MQAVRDIRLEHDSRQSEHVVVTETVRISHPDDRYAAALPSEMLGDLANLLGKVSPMCNMYFAIFSISVLTKVQLLQIYSSVSNRTSQSWRPLQQGDTVLIITVV